MSDLKLKGRIAEILEGGKAISLVSIVENLVATREFRDASAGKIIDMLDDMVEDGVAKSIDKQDGDREYWNLDE